ncbi:hypothetical protein Tco_0601760 [Tanacetum coccineum]
MDVTLFVRKTGSTATMNVHLEPVDPFTVTRRKVRFHSLEQVRCTSRKCSAGNCRLFTSSTGSYTTKQEEITYQLVSKRYSVSIEKPQYHTLSAVSWAYVLDMRLACILLHCLELLCTISEAFLKTLGPEQSGEIGVKKEQQLLVHHTQYLNQSCVLMYVRILL